MNHPAAKPDRDDVLRYLRVFLSVAHTGSVTRSSEQIFKAASAITRALTQLEDLLGVSLFERRPRGMLLNAYGEAVHRRALRIHKEIQHAATALCQSRGSRIDPTPLTQLLLGGNKLRIFVSLAEHGQFSPVCQQLGLSKSGISMSLTRLEEAVGQPLLQRMTQGLVVTDAGEQLLLHAKRAFAELRHIEADLSALRGSLSGTITVGALPLCRTSLLPLAIARLLQRYPGLKIKTSESPFAELARGLHCGDIDLIFGALRQGNAAAPFYSEALFQDEVGIFCRRGHPLARLQRRIRLAELQGAGWILPREESPARQALVQAFLRAGLPAPKPSVESGDLAVVRQLLAHSELLTACSAHQLHVEIASGAIVPLVVDLGDTRRHIGITQRLGSSASPAIEALLEEIRQLCADLPDEAMAA